MKFYNVKSFSDPKKVYTVRHMGFGDWRCDCAHFVFRRKGCDHILRVRHLRMKRHGRNKNKK